MYKVTRSARIWDKSKLDYITVLVEIEVDFQGLADEYAARAFSNKSKVVKECRGSVKVRASS